MKIKEIRTSYNIIVTSQEEHLEVIDYLESLKESAGRNAFTKNWDKICFHSSSSRWTLLSESYSPYKLPSITFTELKDLLTDNTMKHKFKVGNTVVIVKEGFGCCGNTVGKTAKITELGDYNTAPGYKIDDITLDTNCRSGGFDGFIGEKSFELFVEEWVPEIGDWIIITRSDSNWNEDMDKYANTLVQITETNNGNSTRFKNDGSWSWNLSDGHFRKAKPHEVDNEVVLFEDALIEIAKTKYPVGTKFYPAHMSEKSRDGKYCIITSDSIFSNDPSGIYSKVDGKAFMPSDNLNYGNTSYNRLVYQNGKWADIIKEESVEKPQATSKYKIGKWYKNTKDGDYGKLCADVTKTRFPCTEYIDSYGKGQYYSSGTYFAAEWMDDLIEADLSEIQKWLPDGHVDKFESLAFRVPSKGFEVRMPKLFCYESRKPADTIIEGAAILSPSGAYYFGSDPYKSDLDELKPSAIKLKTIKIRKLTNN